MSDLKSTYDDDFFLWSKAQAEALRAAARGATNQPIDWENVAEEIESLGRSDKRELSSQIGRIIEHLLKLEHSRARGPRAGWIDSIEDTRNQMERLLEDSPSLRREVDAAIAIEMKRGLRKALREFEQYGETDSPMLAHIHAKTYRADQILGDWFPPDLEAPPRRGEQPYS